MPGSAPGPDNEPHSIVLCDDRRELRSAIRLTLSDAPRFQVVGEASDGVTCLQRVMQFHPDGLIMDFSMPGGCPLPVKASRELHPELHIIVFSGRPDDRTRDAMLDAGANQYVVKIGRLRPLIEALDRAFTPISGRCRNQRHLDATRNVIAALLGELGLNSHVAGRTVPQPFAE